MKKRSNHEGSFFQQDGRWYCKISVRNEAGETIRKTASGKTRAEAAKQAEEIKRQFAAKVFKRITLGQWLTRWLDVYCKSKRTSTRETYKSLIKRHLLPNIGHLFIAELRPDDISGLFADLLDGLSAATVTLIYNILSAALRQAVKSEVAYRNIMQAVDKPKIEAVNHAILSENQLRDFIDRVKASPYSLAYLLMVCGGLRRGEALAAKWENLDFKSGSIQITETLVRVGGGLEFNQPKSRQSRRTVALPEEVLKELKAVRRKSGLMTSDAGAPLHPDKLWADFRKIKYDLKLGALTLHELRHSHSSHLLKSKIPLSDVSRRLGHSSIRTTNDIYAHIVPESSDNAAEAINKLIAGGN